MKKKRTMKTIKSIIKRISPSTIEKLEREKKGDELLKEVIKELINIYDAIELEEYFEIQKDLLAYYKGEPTNNKKNKSKK